MKTLYLLRHAKSSWKQPGVSDRERDLNARGQRDAPRMGAALAQFIPAMSIAVSPARRAQLTLEGLCRGWPGLAEVSHRTEEDLYTFSADHLFDWISEQDESAQSLFIIGHNPGLTDLVNSLTGEHRLDNLPTAGYLQLQLQIDHWRDLLLGCAVIERRLFPKEL